MSAFSTWFRRYRPAPGARRLFVCFPHAGGSAAFYRPWAEALGTGAEVLAAQYPGRQDRMDDPFPADLDSLAAEIAAALAPALGRPLTLFGHSLGAAVAHEVARLLPGEVGRLVVSGRPGPGRTRRTATHLLPGPELWDAACRLGGTPPELAALPELRDLALPALRADYRLSETHRPRPGPPLHCPVLACLGDRDPEVTPAEAHDWARVTDAGFRLRVFPGGHFYLVRGRDALLREIARCPLAARAAR
ncbi:thioesterase II family protein [Bailinhaonella thermotolerans]|uniref:Thioesterase n=1 Tax=Bailinhaonella thermotolerans TaxID=1070861 RepID=A0A3A4AZY7_9ACTN|nr:alpha/beta fold hydrolase [Bailinhaonella thermotolerans]RJL27208.1 thioesterase [Bailinhaonella thermotolerans]